MVCTHAAAFSCTCSAPMSVAVARSAACLRLLSLRSLSHTQASAHARTDSRRARAYPHPAFLSTMCSTLQPVA
eukprot:5299437-Pleurochrysis_carterae.AAC.2